MVRAKSVLIVAAILALALQATPGRAEIVTSDQVLRVQFTVDNNFTPEPPDVLRLNFGLIDVLAALTERNARLLDCTDELGFASTDSFGGHVGLLNLDPSNSWKTEDSLWDFDNPGIADFTPILDGSIRGRVDFFPTTGEADIPLAQVNLNFVKATSPSGGIVVTPVPTVTRAEVVPMLLEPNPGQAGLDNTFSVSGGTVGNRVYFLAGLGCGPVTVPNCGGAVVDIAQPLILGSAIVGADGFASIDRLVPGGASGRTVVFQAFERESCKASNSVSYTFP